MRFSNLIFITIMFTNLHPSANQPEYTGTSVEYNQNTPEPDENPGIRPTDNTSQTQSAPDILTAAGKLYDDLMAGTLSLETLQDSQIVVEIAQQLVK